MKSWHIDLLGTLCLRCGEQVIPRFRTRKDALLLAYLAVTRTFHSRDHLAELFWPEREQGRAAVSLRVSLNALRSLLQQIPNAPELLSANRALVGLHPEAFTTDLQAFEQRLQKSARASGDQREQHLQVAADLYKGAFLKGYADVDGAEEWIIRRRLMLEAQYESTLQELARIFLHNGQAQTALNYLSRAAELAPDSEPIQDLLRETKRRQTKQKPPASPTEDSEARREALLFTLRLLCAYTRVRLENDKPLPSTELRTFRKALFGLLAVLPQGQQETVLLLSVFPGPFTQDQALWVSATPPRPSSSQGEGKGSRTSSSQGERGVPLLDKEGAGEVLTGPRNIPTHLRETLEMLAGAGLLSCVEDPDPLYSWLEPARTLLSTHFPEPERTQVERKIMNSYIRIAASLRRRVNALSKAEWIHKIPLLYQEALRFEKVLQWILAKPQHKRYAFLIFRLLHGILLFAPIDCPLSRWIPSLWEDRHLRSSSGYFHVAKLYSYWAFINGDTHAAVNALLELAQVVESEDRPSFRKRIIIAHILYEQGVCLYYAGQIQAAKTLYEKVLYIQRELEWKEIPPQMIMSLGDVHVHLKDWEQAEHCYQQAQTALHSGSHDVLGVASFHYRYGTMKIQMGDYAAARRMLNEALQLRQKHRDENGVAECLRELGVIALRQGLTGEARFQFERARETFRALQKTDSEAALLLHIGDLEEAEGNHEEAVCLWQVGYDHWCAAGHPGWTERFRERLANQSRTCVGRQRRGSAK